MKPGWDKKGALMQQLNVLKVLLIAFLFVGLLSFLPQKVSADAPVVSVTVTNIVGVPIEGVTLTWTDKNNEQRSDAVYQGGGIYSFASWQKIDHPGRTNNAFGCFEGTHTIVATKSDGTFDRALSFDMENNEDAVNVGTIIYTPSVVTPTVSLTVDKATIDNGGTVTLNWSSTNKPDSCVAGGDWDAGAQKSGTGSQVIGPVDGGVGGRNLSFNLICTNSAGSATGIAAVHVNAIPAPTCTVTAEPAVPVLGQSVTWTGVAAAGTGTAYTYVWSGTDGLSSTQSSVVGVYSTIGTKTANLTVTAAGVSGTCTATVNMGSGLTVTDTQINKDGVAVTSIVADGVTQYSLSVTGTDPLGVSDLAYQFVGINVGGTEFSNSKGIIGWGTNVNTWPGWEVGNTTTPIDCTGGGKAVKYTKVTGNDNAYGSAYVNLLSCSTTTSGNSRTSSFVVTFSPTFTAPTAGNKVEGVIGNIAKNGTSWTSFAIFGLAPTTTVAYKISETVAGLDVAPEKPYTLDKDGNLITDYTFINPKIGVNTVFVVFKDSKGKWGGCGANQSLPCFADIELIAQPTMGSCNVDTSNPNQITFDILPKPGVGNGYGSATGKVEMGDVDLQALKLVRWDDNRIKAVLSGQPTDQEFQIKITDAKGLTVEGVCSSLSQLSLGAKLFCRAPQATTISDVELILVEGKAKGTKKTSTVTIDKKGVVQGLDHKLVEGQPYKVSIKAPKSVRKNIEFFAGAGTNIFNKLRLPVGDIFPLDGGDGRINSADAAELFREWRVLGSGAEKPGDFNGDGLINSFEWACMRFDFGASDDEEPVPGPLSIKNPNVSVVQTRQGGLSSQSTGVGSTGSSGVGTTGSF